MNLDIDLMIFVGFLVVNLAIGLFYSKGIRNMREYAIGDRNFSTSTLTATIMATWVGGGVFSLTISKVYSDGLYYIFLNSGEVLAFFIVA